MILLDTIQLCFSKENYQVRMLSISIFHKIISNIPVNIEIEENQYQLNEFITKHIHFNLMRLFLHSNDENNAVKNICLKTLIIGLSIILNTDVTLEINKSKENVGDDFNRVYDDFIGSICRLLCEKYPKSISFHINNCLLQISSFQDNIRAYSLYIVGVFYSCLLKENSEEINEIQIKEVYKKSCLLLKDVSMKVRLRTIKTLGFFKTINK